eukprot:TRINITY_DN1466_c0_g1_i1.p1 TRINITY_DN1466_c0_g1~~TRINITY_DN1466_c0_g1_i1.p1  ORF type:complete len:62 (+),score=9.42 TRINITY_DN1466_c0_g1_i1:150-335(+)
MASLSFIDRESCILNCYPFIYFYFHQKTATSAPHFLILYLFPHVLCVDTGRSSETAKAHRG